MRPLSLAVIAMAALPGMVAAQAVDGAALLRPGAMVRIWEGSASGQSVEMTVVERRGDSLDVKRDAITSNGVMVQRAERRTLAWRSLVRLDVRGERVKDSPFEGAVIGAFLGVIIGSLAGTESSGDISLDSASGGSLGPLLFGGLGLLLGLGIDAAKTTPRG